MSNDSNATTSGHVTAPKTGTRKRGAQKTELLPPRRGPRAQPIKAKPVFPLRVVKPEEN